MAKKIKLPKAQRGGGFKLRKPKTLDLDIKTNPIKKFKTIKRFLDIKNNPTNQVNKSNSIFDNTLAFKESQDLIDQMRGLVNKTDESSQIAFMNAAGQLQVLNPNAAFHFNTGEGNQYKHIFKDHYDMKKGPMTVPLLDPKTGQYTNVGDAPLLAQYMKNTYPNMVDVNMTGRMPLNMSVNSVGTPYYSE